ncbi:lysylphosphatidylglycerol synthase transmembrane domain-containing protein [Devosia sp. SL43]|uniref:lysylphosphatidylglycerol synthase transmembrane domain-containing protein n=1 Tax=Devosia sp. SL43 TaxID=2806348 RepID=UPI001F411804|nr:lysylphosphatidylglycerol synthase transmembrane domain-containing protein [Devosia sp. SL43]UJW86216.1 flippase-like domain-containing protein [Devosia sp. SL43]
MTAAALERRTWARSLWPLLLRLAPPVVIIGLLWSLADGPGALALLAGADWRNLFLAFVAVNLQTIASAWRWHRVASRLGQTIPFGHAVAEYYLSQLVNQSLPGGVLGDAARAVRARHEVGLGIAAKAVIIERLAGQIAMFGLLTVALVWALFNPRGLALALGPEQLMAGTLVLLAVVALYLVASRLARRHRRRPLGASIATALFARGAWKEQLPLACLIVALNLASFTLCALATGTTLGLESIVVLVPLILCAMLIPTTVAGWGFREGAAAALFPLAGATAAAGFAASIAFGIIILAASLPGLFVLLRQPPKPA